LIEAGADFVCYNRVVAVKRLLVERAQGIRWGVLVLPKSGFCRPEGVTGGQSGFVDILPPASEVECDKRKRSGKCGLSGRACMPSNRRISVLP